MPRPQSGKPTQYELKHYAAFAGKTIVRVELVEIEPGFDLVPTFTFNDGTFAQVWRDPEGNGAGYLSHCTPEGHEIIPDGLRTGDFNKPT